jgi:hypothetical protein
MAFKSKPATLEGEDVEWLAAVGLLAVYWADFENIMDAHIAVMLVQPSASHIAPNAKDTQEALEITFNKRIRMWKDLADALPLDPELKQRNLALADRAREARNHRDLLLHGMTRRHPDGQMKANHLPRKEKQEPQHIPYPPSKVLAVAGEILDLEASVTHLMVQTMSALLESSEKKSGG